MTLFTDPTQIKIRSALILKRNVDVSELCFFCDDLASQIIDRTKNKTPLLTKPEIETMEDLVMIICNDHFELEYPQTWLKTPQDKKDFLIREIVRKISELVLNTKREEIFETIQYSTIMITNELFEQIIKPLSNVPKQ